MSRYQAWLPMGVTGPPKRLPGSSCSRASCSADHATNIHHAAHDGPGSAASACPGARAMASSEPSNSVPHTHSSRVVGGLKSSRKRGKPQVLNQPSSAAQVRREGPVDVSVVMDPRYRRRTLEIGPG